MTNATTVPPVLTPRPDLRAAAEDFLFGEAELLDSWRLVQWFKLFAPGGQYLVPTTDLPDGDAAQDLMLVHDDYPLLEQRVKSLLRRSAHAEFPQSRTRHLITNVRILQDAGDAEDAFEVRANFVVYRIRAGRTDRYIGSYRHRLVRADDDFRFLVRRSVLDHDALTQGKLSIIL
ncbi:MAG: p-cumate dioxygenase [Massilia sp.]|jgi:p-cumate 2,3-dioxygenase beta subunit|nr:p-cumate dioxygenase [Gemmatimonadales bacterium]MDB5910535.1 p-cumate dioxygenase [Massilia sp.]